MRRFFTIILAFALVFSPLVLFGGQTGKIAGKITDENTGEALIGANVFLEGTLLGAATDAEGFYFIINVPPGTYTLKVSYAGYAEYTVTEVEVQTDLTTPVDVALSSEILTTEAVVVVAEKPVVQKDVAGSQVNISNDQIQALPVTTVQEVIGLQAGVTSDFGIRGSGSDQVLFVVDGISLRDNRTNDPISEVPLSAIQEVSVQSGGIGAEYSNVRSGVVNIVSKEGDLNRYSGTIQIKSSNIQQKHFGISPYNKNSFWFKPYFDPDVMWTGTDNGVWDEYTKRQYPQFAGWNAISEQLLNDGDPTNDLTPEGAKRLFEWQHRKQGDIDEPDYNIDAGFGGPVPFISKDLGNLRFYASYKREREMYLVELATPDLLVESYMLRLTSDISPATKLTIMGLYSETDGTSNSTSGYSDIFTNTSQVAARTDRAGFTVPWRLYGNIYFSKTKRFSHTLSAKIRQTVDARTFWEAKITKVGKIYRTGPGANRNFNKVYEIVPGFFVDEAPYGFSGDSEYSVEGRLGMGGAVSTSRDSSEIHSWSGRFDITSQVHRNHEVKAGLEFNYNNYDMSFGLLNFFLPEGNTWSTIEENPITATAYVSDKIEFEGFVANVGMIFDYFNSNGKWYEVDNFDPTFFSQDFDPEQESDFKTKDAVSRLTISPRLAISHPIGETSKLFFNYGHYRQMPTSERMFRLQRTPTDQLDYLGDPNLPRAKTISYELGFDQGLYDTYLIRAAAYYKDVSDQEFWVRYINTKGNVNYYKISNKSYEDIRGIELDITKRTGRWLTGFVNYEYRVGTSGYFGIAQIYENPAEQREYLRRNVYQEKPRPRPRIKSVLDFHTPPDLGPNVMGQRPAGGWSFNFITSWTAGLWDTWNPNNIPGIEYNIQWNDYYNVDLRISKTFPFKDFDVKIFADVNNLTNHKYFSRESFYDSFDYNYYMESLHLPEDITDELKYGNIPGDDNPGDYREHGVDYQPMEYVRDLDVVITPNSRAIYYDASNKMYMQYVNGNWEEVSKSRIDKINDTKAYIDMPNQTFFTFLNPRNYFFGLTLTYKF